jgi:thiamine pyrophosphokinase
MRTAIIANGEINDYAATKAALQNAEQIIACDGGLSHAEKMQILPHAIIGDLDSAPPQYLKFCQENKVPIHRYPAKKDETDLALAMQFALKNATSIIILCALGGRIDHALANIHILAMAGDTPAELQDEKTSIHLVHHQITLPKQHYKTLSLLPLSTTVTGIKTTGLLYPLNNEPLTLGNIRGISNQFTKTKAKITIKTGTLLVIRSAEDLGDAVPNPLQGDKPP